MILKVYRKVAKDALASLAQIRHPREAECVASRFLRPRWSDLLDLRPSVKTTQLTRKRRPVGQHCQCDLGNHGNALWAVASGQFGRSAPLQFPVGRWDCGIAFSRVTSQDCQGGAALQLRVRSQGSLLVAGCQRAAALQVLVARPFVP